MTLFHSEGFKAIADLDYRPALGEGLLTPPFPRPKVSVPQSGLLALQETFGRNDDGVGDPRRAPRVQSKSLLASSLCTLI